MTLSDMCLTGRHLPTDPRKAAYYCRLAAKKGHRLALNKMGHFYLLGLWTPKNLEMAFKCFQKAADLDDLDSLICLADFYERGLVGPIDTAKAKELREKAVKVKELAEAPKIDFFNPPNLF
jgi:TPR repeat protein